MQTTNSGPREDLEFFGLSRMMDPGDLVPGEKKTEDCCCTISSYLFILTLNCLFIFLGDIEESETEAVWSDGDLNLASSNVSF